MGRVDRRGGAKAFVILLAYSLVPVVVGGILVGGVWAATGGSPGSIGAAGFVLAGLITLVLFVAVAYVSPAALANFAAEGHTGAGFDFEELRPVLATGTYATGWLLAAGIVLVGSFVSGILNAVPFLGTVLGATVAFYALVAAYYVIGRTWKDSTPSPSTKRTARPRASDRRYSRRPQRHPMNNH